MRRFAELFESLDRTTSTNDKVAAMAAFFRDAPKRDAAWVLFILTGRKLKRLLSARAVAGWVQEELGIPNWLFRESYSGVGDLAETIALILDQADAPASESTDVPLNEWINDRILLLKSLDPPEQRAAVMGWLRGLNRAERFLLVKLLTGEMRVGVSQTLVAKALAQIAGVPQATMAHRLAGNWSPDEALIARLLSGADARDDASRPYPLFLASPIEELAADGKESGSPRELGDVKEWQLEWKWDGIRAQLLRRGGETYIWSRGDELITQRFPELVEFAARLPAGTVLDGEILTWKDGKPLGFATLQTRIGRISLSRKILADAPTAFIAYDLLEFEGTDIRQQPLKERRALLEAVVGKVRSAKLIVSEVLAATSWDDAAALRATSRGRTVEGIMVKRLASPYQSGRVRGDWWKWKIDPLTFDGVLVYAEPGHGRRANLLTDYTFAVWDNAQLVPVARAYSGLNDEEIAELDKWIRQHSSSRHGPVRTVEPLRVFELAFEGIAFSQRHRGGIATRFPRILRERTDKQAKDADTLKRLKALIPPTSTPEPTLFG